MDLSSSSQAACNTTEPETLARKCCNSGGLAESVGSADERNSTLTAECDLRPEGLELAECAFSSDQVSAARLLRARWICQLIDGRFTKKVRCGIR